MNYIRRKCSLLNIFGKMEQNTKIRSCVSKMIRFKSDASEPIFCVYKSWQMWIDPLNLVDVAKLSGDRLSCPWAVCTYFWFLLEEDTSVAHSFAKSGHDDGESNCSAISTKVAKLITRKLLTRPFPSSHYLVWGFEMLTFPNSIP